MIIGRFVHYKGYSIWVEKAWVDASYKSYESVARDIYDSGWIVKSELPEEQEVTA